MQSLHQSFYGHTRTRQGRSRLSWRAPIGLCAALVSAAMVLVLTAQPGVAGPPSLPPENNFQPPVGVTLEADLSAAITAAARTRAGADIEIDAWAFADRSLGLFVIYQTVSLAHSSDAVDQLLATVGELSPPTVTETRRDSATTTATFTRDDLRGISRTSIRPDHGQIIRAHSATCFYNRRVPKRSQALCDQALNQLVPIQ